MRTFFCIIILLLTFVQWALCQTSASDSSYSPDSLKPATDSIAVLKQTTRSVSDSLQQTFSDTVSAVKDTANLVVPVHTTIDTSAKDTAGSLVPTSSKIEEREKLDPNGYRDMYWGMTLQEVREHVLDRDNVNEYDVQPLNNGFEYPTNVAGVKAYSAYEFDSDRLYAVRLNMLVNAKNRFDFLDAYEHYQTILKDKYGEPTKKGFAKIDPSYLNTIESVILGFAKKYTFWEFPHTYLALVLTGVNKHLEIHITYVSKEIFDELKDRKATMNLEDF